MVRTRRGKDRRGEGGTRGHGDKTLPAPLPDMSMTSRPLPLSALSFFCVLCVSATKRLGGLRSAYARHPTYESFHGFRVSRWDMMNCGERPIFSFKRAGSRQCNSCKYRPNTGSSEQNP